MVFSVIGLRAGVLKIEVRQEAQVKFGLAGVKMTIFMYLSTILLLPLYLWESGLPQVGHYLGALWVIFTLLMSRKFYWHFHFRYLILLVIYAAIVNSLVFSHYLDPYSLLSAGYYIYNLLLFLTLVETARRTGYQVFFKLTLYAFLLLLLAQIILNFMGLGRLFGESRFMGTFNDPNQFAHWILWSVIIVAISSWYLYKTFLGAWVGLGLGVVLLILSASRSGLVGMVWVGFSLFITLFFNAFDAMYKKLNPVNLARSLLVSTLLFVTTIGCLVAAFYLLPNIQTKITDQVEFFTSRATEGLVKGGENFEERGYDRLWKFPEYLLLGSGEGANERWSERTSFTGEIHSTLAGLAFYYGLPGVVMFFGFLYNLWRRIPYIWMRLLLIAPFIYSLSTYNLRNSMFWVGMGIFWIIADALRGRQKSQSEREWLTSSREYRSFREEKNEQ